MIEALFTLFWVLLAVGLFCWAIANIPGLPAPIVKLVQVIVVVVVGFWIIMGHGHIEFPR